MRIRKLIVFPEDLSFVLSTHAALPPHRRTRRVPAVGGDPGDRVIDGHPSFIASHSSAATGRGLGHCIERIEDFSNEEIADWTTDRLLEKLANKRVLTGNEILE